MKLKISVSFIKSNYNEKETIKRINDSIADYIHVDIMDGKFVPYKNYTYSDILNFTKGINKPLDVHLMCDNPSKYIKDYVVLNTKYITFHIEAVNNPLDIINEIHSYGISCGIAINPETDINKIIPYLSQIDLVLIMSVHPGKGGQEFINDSILKINELNKYKNNNNFIISIDGGINEINIQNLNVDMAVSGSFICKSNDFNKQINLLKNNH